MHIYATINSSLHLYRLSLYSFGSLTFRVRIFWIYKNQNLNDNILLTLLIETSKHKYIWLLWKNDEIFQIFNFLCCWDMHTHTLLFLISNMEKILIISLKVQFVH